MRAIYTTFLIIGILTTGICQERYSWALSLEYDQFEDVKNGHILINHQSKKGIIDTSGHIVVPIQYDLLTPLSENIVGAGFFNPKKRDKQAGFIDTSTTFIIPQNFEKVARVHESRAAVLYRNKWGYINNKGRWLLLPKFDAADIFINGHARVQADGKWGLIRRDGVFIVDNDYEILHPVSENLLAAKLDEKWGFVDTTNQFLIPAIYDNAFSFQNQLAVVAKKNKYGAINHQGKTIIPFEHKEMRPFSYGLAPAKKRNKWGFINRQNEWVIKPKYEEAYSFSNGVARVKIDNQYGFVDTKGELVIPNIFQEAYDFKETLARVYTKNKKGFIRYIPQEIEMDNPLANPEEVTSRNIKKGHTIKVNNSKLTILISDHKKVDNDIVSINFQGKWVVKDKALVKKPYSFDIELKKGENFTKKNYLLLYAMNLGQNPPNTAKLTILDGKETREIVLESDMKNCDIIYFQYE